MRYPATHRQQVVIQTALPQTAVPVEVMTSAPSVSNDHLAMQLHQNWLTKNPKLEHLAPATNKDSLDDSLTSLNWLQNMNLSLGAAEATPPISPRGGTVGTEAMRVNPNQVLATNVAQQQSPLADFQMPAFGGSINYEKIDYKTNPYVKPPHR